MTIYDRYLKIFPKDGTFDSYAAFFWMQEHKQQAEEALIRSDLEAALRWAQAGPRGDYHVKLQGELRLLTGRIREARRENAEAVAEYEAIVKNGAAYESEVVASAKERLGAIRALGGR
jgi:hypothetical protein